MSCSGVTDEQDEFDVGTMNAGQGATEFGEERVRTCDRPQPGSRKLGSGEASARSRSQSYFREEHSCQRHRCRSSAVNQLPVVTHPEGLSPSKGTVAEPSHPATNASRVLLTGRRCDGAPGDRETSRLRKKDGDRGSSSGQELSEAMRSRGDVTNDRTVNCAGEDVRVSLEFEGADAELAYLSFPEGCQGAGGPALKRLTADRSTLSELSWSRLIHELERHRRFCDRPISAPRTSCTIRSYLRRNTYRSSIHHRYYTGPPRPCMSFLDRSNRSRMPSSSRP